MVTWGDHQISPDSSERLLIRETEASRSISQCEIHPCLPPTSLWMLEILLGGKNTEGASQRVEEEWLPQGKKPGAGGGWGGISSSGLVSGCCLHVPGPGFQGFVLSQTRPACFAHFSL